MREIGPERARDFLVGHHGLRAVVDPPGAEGARAVLARLRCVQLDPLDAIGTNADLVAMARVDGLARGDVHRHLLPGHAFEHFAKERCLLPAARFPDWRAAAVETPWWRSTERERRLTRALVADVLAEVRDRGPIAVGALADRGRTEPIDWNGWKGTPMRTRLAVEVLWRECAVVVCGKAGRDKVIDVPERALPQVAHAPPAGPFEEVALLDRVEAAGLLSEASGPHWSMLSEVRTGPLPDALVARGALERVRLAGSRRTYLAPAGALERTHPEDDGRLRILGPLDPLLWDRKLVEHAFGFEYVWEVYKPAARRRWGWYVVPLLHAGRLVGRMEARAVDGAVVVDRLWREDGAPFPERAFHEALERHAAGL